MKNRYFPQVLTNFLLITVFVLILSGTFFALTHSATANEARDASAVAATVGNSFTYQGELNNNGTVVNDSCDMQFSLFDAASGGSQAGITLPKSNVVVSNGLFTVELDFGNQFTGDARYLQIAVSCPTGSSFTTLNGRVALNAAPYALSLRPGAVINGAVSGDGVVQAINSSGSNGATGLYGYASDASNEVYGVYGKINTSDGSAAGVYGWSTTGSAAGVRGDTTSNSQYASGVYGSTNDNGQVYGVHGTTTSSSNRAAGVAGWSTANSGEVYGIYGFTSSPSGYGVYSQGNAHVEGNLTWKPMTSTVSIPAAAFQPSDNGYIFTNSGHTLTPGNASSNTYLTPVQLPQGATITKVTFYWTDTDGGAVEGGATLYRIDFTGGETSMVTVDSNGSAGAGSSTSSAIATSTIDNSLYGYYIWLRLPSANVSAHAVVIEYTTTQPH